MQEYRLADLGEGMQEAELRRWLVKPGDTVKMDQTIALVETDKAVVELPAPYSGRVATLNVQEGEVAQLGQVLAVFDVAENKPGVSPPHTSHTVVSTAQNGAAQPSTPQSAAVATSNRPPQRVLAAPAVRKRAFELGIDLSLVQSSQASGRITMDDLHNYVQRSQQAPLVPAPEIEPAQTNGVHTLSTAERSEQKISIAEEERKPLAGLRKRIAERMEHAWRTIPHATAFDDLDGTELAALRQALKPIAAQRNVRLTYMPLLVKLLIPLLKEFPIFNASLDEERREIIYKRRYHIGIAAATPEGLLVPVLRDADTLTIIQIAERLEHLTTGAQQRTLALTELSGSTFTLNNVGSFGGASGTPIINHPEVAILAVGRLQEQAVVRNGTIVARLMMPLALSFDHRLIDGALAGQFLGRFKSLVEQPQQLLLDLV